MGTVRVKHFKLWCIGNCQWQDSITLGDNAGSVDAKKSAIEAHSVFHPNCHLGSTGVEVEEVR